MRMSVRNLLALVLSHGRLDMSKFAIVANGNFSPSKMLEEITRDSKIIALDGAAPRLMQRGIMPDVILGDFDSIERSKFGIRQEQVGETANLDFSAAYKGRYGITVVPAKNQDYSDLQKGIRYAKEQGATEINILCATSESRMDHTINNLRILRAEYDPACNIRLHGVGQSMLFVKDSKFTMRGAANDQCGIFSFPAASFSSEGLVWNGEKANPFVLDFGRAESACNLMATDTATILIQGEALVTHPPLYATQKNFSEMGDGLHKILAKEASLVLVSTTKQELERAVVKADSKIKTPKSDEVSYKIVTEEDPSGDDDDDDDSGPTLASAPRILASVSPDVRKHLNTASDFFPAVTARGADEPSDLVEKTLFEKVLASSFAGSSRVILTFGAGHPFDLVKTRMQANPSIFSAHLVAENIYKCSGVRGFYVGGIPNFARTFLKEAYRSPIRGASKQFYKGQLPEPVNTADFVNIATGLTMATADTFIVCPLERLKVWLMTRYQQEKNLSDFFRQQRSPSALVSELFRGLNVSFLRSGVSWVSYLVAEEKVWGAISKLRPQVSAEHKSLPLPEQLLAGSLSGMINCITTLPLDTVKTHMQREGSISSSSVVGMMKEIHQVYGMRGLYAGWQARLPHYVMTGVLTSHVIREVDKIWAGPKG